MASPRPPSAPSTILTTLLRSGSLGGIEPDRLRAMMRESHVESYAAGSVLFEERGVPDAMFVVLSGTVALYQSGYLPALPSAASAAAAAAASTAASASTAAATSSDYPTAGALALRSAGESFGELDLLCGCQRLFAAAAVTSVQCLRIGLEAYRVACGAAVTRAGKTLSFLRQLPALDPMSERELSLLVANVRIERYRAGDEVGLEKRAVIFVETGSFQTTGGRPPAIIRGGGAGSGGAGGVGVKSHIGAGDTVFGPLPSKRPMVCTAASTAIRMGGCLKGDGGGGGGGGGGGERSTVGEGVATAIDTHPAEQVATEAIRRMRVAGNQQSSPRREAPGGASGAHRRSPRVSPRPPPRGILKGRPRPRPRPPGGGGSQEAPPPPGMRGGGRRARGRTSGEVGGSRASIGHDALNSAGLSLLAVAAAVPDSSFRAMSPRMPARVKHWQRIAQSKRGRTSIGGTTSVSPRLAPPTTGEPWNNISNNNAFDMTSRAIREQCADLTRAVWDVGTDGGEGPRRQAAPIDMTGESGMVGGMVGGDGRGPVVPTATGLVWDQERGWSAGPDEDGRLAQVVPLGMHSVREPHHHEPHHDQPPHQRSHQQEEDSFFMTSLRGHEDDAHAVLSEKLALQFAMRALGATTVRSHLKQPHSGGSASQSGHEAPVSRTKPGVEAQTKWDLMRPADPATRALSTREKTVYKKPPRDWCYYMQSDPSAIEARPLNNRPPPSAAQFRKMMKAPPHRRKMMYGGTGGSLTNSMGASTWSLASSGISSRTNATRTNAATSASQLSTGGGGRGASRVA